MLVHSFTSSDREKPLSVLEGFLLSQLEEFMREIEKQPDDEVCCCFVVVAVVVVVIVMLY